MSAPSPRPFFITDDFVAVGHALAQAGFSFEVDCSPDYRSGVLLLSSRARAWLEERFPGISKAQSGDS